MRMTALVAMRRPRAGLLDVVATCAALAFLLLIVWPAYEYAYDEASSPRRRCRSPTLARRGAAGRHRLMLLFALLRLARGRRLAPRAARAVRGRRHRGLWLLGPALRPLGNLNLLIFFVGCRRPHACSPACRSPSVRARDLRLSRADHPHAADGVVVGRMDEGMSHLILLSVPLFVFLGLLIEMTGMARAMVAFLASLLGHVRGGLHYVLVGAMYLVSGISGSKAADMAAVAPVLFPEMKAPRRQARRSRRAALGHRRADRDHPAEPRADHHRLGHRRLDRGAVHRRAAAGRGAGDHAVRRGVVALPRRGPEPRQARDGARSAGPSSSPCPRSRCRS
jgi:hypothetical protein